jgi:hypothetical protein
VGGARFQNKWCFGNYRQRAIKEYETKRRGDLFWVVLGERQLKNTIYFKIGVATPGSEAKFRLARPG